MKSDLLFKGLELMLVGMGVVFVFLSLLVLATVLMSKAVMRLQPLPARPEVSDEEVAAISAAIARHRGDA